MKFAKFLVFANVLCGAFILGHSLSSLWTPWARLIGLGIALFNFHAARGLWKSIRRLQALRHLSGKS